MGTESSADVLSALAPLLRVRPELQQVCRFGAQWSSEHAAQPERWAPFHLVNEGACVIELAGTGRSIALSAGDIVVLPHGTRHSVRSSAADARPSAPTGIRSRPLGDVELRYSPDVAADTHLICGRLRFDAAHANLALAALPEAIVICSARSEPVARRLRWVMSAIREELESATAGSSAIAGDLASALFMMVVRTHLEREGAGNGLLRLLAHKQAGRAAAAILQEPARRWTLDELAARAYTSRASLVRMFRQTVQLAPLTFIAEIRLELARSRMAARDDWTLGNIAAAAGYGSASAFSRAFHRRFGQRPGRMRARAAYTGEQWGAAWINCRPGRAGTP